MNSLELRQALGHFGTGVCLITVNDPEAGPLALTANSFASVSLEPPLVLWSIQNRSECFQQYTDCPYFGISILGKRHEALSNHYARRGQHPVRPEEFEACLHDVPRLKGALAHFTCRLHTTHDGGDHRIVVGEVIAFNAADDEPLIFYGGGYRGLSVEEGNSDS